eukprot:405661-Prorocentrum_minimum.AAC.5
MFRPRVGSSFGCRFRRFRLGCCGRLGFGPWSCGYRFGLLRVCRFIRFPRACAPAGGRVPPLSVPPLSAAPALSPVTFTAALAFLALRPELVCALRRISPPGGQISPPRCRFTVRLAAGGHTVGGNAGQRHQLHCMLGVWPLLFGGWQVQGHLPISPVHHAPRQSGTTCLVQ